MRMLSISLCVQCLVLEISGTVWKGLGATFLLEWVWPCWMRYITEDGLGGLKSL